MTTFWAERVWTGTQPDGDVLIDVSDDGTIQRVASGSRPTPDATRLHGTLLPGLVNGHSHAFHRALRGRSRSGTDFWQWRDGMYRLSEVLDPDRYRRLATAVYAEMALTGITAVGEFHYLHHRSGGGRYTDPNEMSHALIEAAGAAGIRLTILDACYLTGDTDGSPPAGAQLRFSDGSVEAWLERHHRLVDHYRHTPDVVIGAAIHSVRAVPEAAMTTIAEMSSGPLHVHVSEQQTENDASNDRYGRSPTRVLADAGALGPATTAVHGVHTSDDDRRLLGDARATVCVCPTTEADLADGFAPVAEMVSAHIPVSLGSDSHAVVDLFSEIQAIEYHDCARLGRRGVHPPDALLGMASVNGGRSLGHERWGLLPGAPADFTIIDDVSIRTAGTGDTTDLALTASASDVKDVIVGGRRVVAGGEHAILTDVPRQLEGAIRHLWEVSG